MPPDSPNTARRKPVRVISLRINRTSTSSTRRALIASVFSRGSVFIAPPLDALELFDREQQLFVAAQRRNQPLPAQLGQIAAYGQQALVELRSFAQNLPVRPDNQAVAEEAQAIFEADPVDEHNERPQQLGVAAGQQLIRFRRANVRAVDAAGGR